jgi:hypothetical protein
MAAPLDIISLYTNMSSSPSNNSQSPPSYLDFVRTMNEIEPTPYSPPPVYTLREPGHPYSSAAEDKSGLVELSCPYSEQELANRYMKEAESKEKPRRRLRQEPLQVIYAHIVPLPTICITPPFSPASPAPKSFVLSKYPSVHSQQWASPPSQPWQVIPGTPSLRRTKAPHFETLREVRRRESETLLRDAYERQTRLFLERTI